MAPSNRNSAMCSSPAAAAPGSGSRRAPAAPAIVRSAKNAATTRPISTARMRSAATVTIAVTAKVAALERLARTTSRTVPAGTIRRLVTINTPASAASGIRDTRPVAV
ncbi:hypothetical protein QP939_46505 [Amycolatopsis nalaikhensis]|uniref:Uncharacterized protein n=1 Tax=Amycolatopsis nalaikhensis TaxID=715472 RepID=A0ABY8XKM2_9PSEU|nr:hypothetical protein [Amycolatopsis sp. 2-2]WIV56174.1 hypothetical protein QP939_46505 [Amycolatopsis sp. 2-2]